MPLTKVRPLTPSRPSWDPLNQGIYQIILALIFYVLPMILMGLTYTHIACVLWKQDIPGAIVNVKHSGNTFIISVMFVCCTQEVFPQEINVVCLLYQRPYPHTYNVTCICYTRASSRTNSTTGRLLLGLIYEG